ncbi:MAG: hypothetical protein M0003_14340 [Acidithiobacillus sp.]|uniref:hypothetical protein n=1 Tax=Acidithiobacillus TaxID=119977 RepID=UPI00230BF997|nr:MULTISPECIES: hypothetical protein [Acidithiobacillus]MDA8153865.1 hypothetical protein [Acidithiobacillus sp.]MEB8473935.1 hypothetical protein [Acidithiobacillus ferriphilus]
MLLPNADKAILNIRKLREYTLNPGHLAGGNKCAFRRSWAAITIDRGHFCGFSGIGAHDAPEYANKARVFASCLGIGQQDSDLLGSVSSVPY